MAGYFVYNKEGFSPKYLPGNSSYGQKGSEGNQGDPGNSVYYTPFNLDNEDDRQIAILYLNTNRLLSNNLDEEAYNEYGVGDLVLDITGVMYTVVSKKDGTLTLNFKESYDDERKIVCKDIIPNKTNELFSFNAACCTSFLKSSWYSWKRERYDWKNNNIRKYSKYDGSPKVYHRHIYGQYDFGNWIKFEVVFDPKEPETKKDEYYYNFCLLLPDGQVLSMQSPTNANVMFIDNRFFFGIAGIGEYTLAECLHREKPGVEDKYANYPYNTKKLRDIIAFNGINIKEYLQKEDDGPLYEKIVDRYNNEDNKYVSLIISNFIENRCTAYVELKNISTGRTFKAEVNEPSFDTSVNINHKPYIESAELNVKWEVVEEDYIYKDGELFKRMDNYMMFDVGRDSELAEDSEEHNFFFLDCFDRNDPTKIGDRPSDIRPHISNKNKYLRMHFKNLISITVLIKFNKFNPDNSDDVENGTKWPACMFYVGKVDTPLLKTVSDADSSAGIYYQSKFVPRGYANADRGEFEDYTLVDAGMASLQIDCTRYNINPTQYHYIDFGAVLLSGYSNVDHRTTQVGQETSHIYEFLSDSLNQGGQSDITIYVRAIADLDATQENTIGTTPDDENHINPDDQGGADTTKPSIDSSIVV